MIRRIIEIDQGLCDGCGICVNACHEGAIALVNNKAVLTRDDYCDGLGDCLPNCPMGAIRFVMKDTLAYDDAAVKANIARKKLQEEIVKPESCGCPSSQERTMHRPTIGRFQGPSIAPTAAVAPSISELTTWPVQLQLVSPHASFFHNADVLVAADCSAYAYPNFHAEFMKDKVTLIACPKLDDAAYVEKMAEILRSNQIRSLQVVRMQVPCCGGLVSMLNQAIALANSDLALQVTVLSTEGQRL